MSSENLPSDDPTADQGVEFRTYSDDAWYSVRLLLERDQVLRIKYFNFPDDHDTLFEAKSFKSLKHLEEFKGRFRAVSLQLQDNECREIVEGTPVCACHCSNYDDVRYYDAIIDGVLVNEHSFKRGEEVCLCTFTLLWLRGPDAGNLTTTTIENICKVQPTLKLNSVLIKFLEMARERTEVTCSDSNSNSIFKGVLGWEILPSCDEGSNTGHRLGSFECLRKDTLCARWSAVKICASEVTSERILSCHDRRQEDKDLGGVKKQCMILIGNLDKSVSPQTIADFLQRETSVLPRVFIYPSLSSEIYTRGTILLDCERDFQKVCDFLNNPNQIVVSSEGRPWVIIEKLVGLKDIKASMGTLMPLSKNILQKGSSGKSNSLKVVCSGCQEFKIANDLKYLYLEFSAHQERLHMRLATEEGRLSCR